VKREALVLGVLAFPLGRCYHTAEQPTDQATIASWNLRKLSDGSREDAELSRIAHIVSSFDLVAIKQARECRALERLKAMLLGWSYGAPPPVGGYKRRSTLSSGTPARSP